MALVSLLVLERSHNSTLGRIRLPESTQFKYRSSSFLSCHSQHGGRALSSRSQLCFYPRKGCPVSRPSPHREPLFFQLSAQDAEVSRIIWWSVRCLDITYAISHGLPPLIHPETTDVRSVDCGYGSERKLLSAISRTTALISKTLHRIYSVNQPTLRDIRQLDDEAEKIYAGESENHNAHMDTLQRFMAMSRMKCCCEMMIIFTSTLSAHSTVASRIQIKGFDVLSELY